MTRVTTPHIRTRHREQPSIAPAPTLLRRIWAAPAVSRRDDDALMISLPMAAVMLSAIRASLRWFKIGVAMFVAATVAIAAIWSLLMLATLAEAIQ